LKAAKGLLGLLEPVSSRIPAEQFRGITTAILLLVVICFVLGIIVRTGPGLRAKNAVEQAVFEKMPGYTFLRGLTKRLTGSSEGQTLQPAQVEIEEALVPAYIVDEFGGRLIHRPRAACADADGRKYLHTATRTRASGRHFVYHGDRRVLEMGHRCGRVPACYEDHPGRPAGPASRRLSSLRWIARRAAFVVVALP
jgi:hypothetical protein